MKGDFTRFTFRPDNQYTSVRLQQGRVSLDADWNEQVDLMAYQTKTAQAAFFGDSGTPKAKAGFKVGYDSKSGLWLTPGRYFVGGLLCELSPSASDASRRPPGTRRRTTSDVRVTVGRNSTDRARAPAKPVCSWPNVRIQTA